jgi:hypothetical protein
MPEKRRFFSDGVENAAVLAGFCCSQASTPRCVLFCAVASAIAKKNRGIRENGQRNALALTGTAH